MRQIRNGQMRRPKTRKWYRIERDKYSRAHTVETMHVTRVRLLQLQMASNRTSARERNEKLKMPKSNAVANSGEKWKCHAQYLYLLCLRPKDIAPNVRCEQTWKRLSPSPSPQQQQQRSAGRAAYKDPWSNNKTASTKCKYSENGALEECVCLCIKRAMPKKVVLLFGASSIIEWLGCLAFLCRILTCSRFHNVPFSVWAARRWCAIDAAAAADIPRQYPSGNVCCGKTSLTHRRVDIQHYSIGKHCTLLFIYIIFSFVFVCVCCMDSAVLFSRLRACIQLCGSRSENSKENIFPVWIYRFSFIIAFGISSCSSVRLCSPPEIEKKWYKNRRKKRKIHASRKFISNNSDGDDDGDDEWWFGGEEDVVDRQR